MMTGSNPLTEPPHTPFPDPLSSSDSESPRLPTQLPALGKSSGTPPKAPETTTADDISLILSTSIARPDPDPMLGSSDHPAPSSIDQGHGDHPDAASPFTMPASRSTSDPLGFDIGIQLAPTGSASKGRATAEVSSDGLVESDSKPSYSMSTLLLASYASAVTLALVWVLWTGRGLNRTAAPASPPPPALDWSRIENKAPRPAPSPPGADRVTSLGTPLLLGDLEITPLVVLFQNVRLYRIVDPEGERRENEDCLVMTLRLTNRSSDRRITPLEASSVRDTGDSARGAFIESSTGQRISMFKLAVESEWSIEGQSFPEIPPGASEDVILVSEPVPERRLAGPLVWRVPLKTGEGRTEEIGVRFARQEVGESGY